MTRGNTRTLEGVIRPGAGGSLSVPIATLEFSASGKGKGGTVYSITKTLADGVTVDDSETSAAPYEIEIDPEDTEDFPTDRAIALTYSLTMTEADGKVSTVVGGVLSVTPN